MKSLGCRGVRAFYIAASKTACGYLVEDVGKLRFVIERTQGFKVLLQV